MSRTRKFISRDVNLTKLQLGDPGLSIHRRVVRSGKSTVGENGRWTDRMKLEKKMDYSAIRALVAQLARRGQKRYAA